MKVKLTKLFLFSIIAGSSYGALNPNPKQCSAKNNNACNLKMEIKCTILDTEFAGQSCMNPDEANEEPFIKIPSDSEQEFQVEYSYTICNEGSKSFDLFDDNPDQSDIIIKGQSIHQWLNKDIFQGGKPMAPGECRTKTARRKLSSSAPKNPTSFKIAGKTDGKWCGCFLFKQSTIEFADKTGGGTPPPSPGPGPSCTGSDSRITQIALPKDEKKAKFIQLYSPGCANKEIKENFSLGVIPDKDYVITHHVHLKGITVRDDGFIVICEDADEAEQIWPGHCDVDLNDDKFFGDKGKDTYVLFSTVINENDEAITTVYDQYGVASPDKGENDRKEQEIKKGKGVAWREEFGEGGSIWIPSEWDIIKDAVAKCKPEDVCFIHPRKSGPLSV
jgi:hypothetical protein